MACSLPAALRLLALTSIVTAACGPASNMSENPGARPGGAGGGGSTGTGGSAATGTGGSSPTGTGGSSASGTGGAGGSGSAPGGGLSLPMVVTTNFDNQGWFADPELEKAFQPGSTIIRQDATPTGPCAMRMSQARGKCLKVSYTPPPNLMPPATGGWVGRVLPDHRADRPTVGDAAGEGGRCQLGDLGGTGAQHRDGRHQDHLPGRRRHRGPARDLQAGTASDSFVVADKPEVLGTGWQSYTLPLSGSYGTNVFGAFAWVLTDTTKAATFYLDNIVWE
jgi:hypothetical protein